VTPEERAALQAELTKLKAKANARRDQPGYAANVAAIDARIAEIEAQLAEG
jgi:phosphopentomutase